jgi:hypothetical protein
LEIKAERSRFYRVCGSTTGLKRPICTIRTGSMRRRAHHWKRRSDELEVSKAKWLQARESEDAKPKKLLAKAHLVKRGAEGSAEKNSSAYCRS